MYLSICMHFDMCVCVYLFTRCILNIAFGDMYVHLCICIVFYFYTFFNLYTFYDAVRFV